MTAERTFTERRGLRWVKGVPVELKDGSYSTEMIRHHWCPCDACGEATWVNADRLTATWACPQCQKRSTRSAAEEVPVCKGRTKKGHKIVHEAIEMESVDPAPGLTCRMTPKCGGKHRKVEHG